MTTRAKKCENEHHGTLRVCLFACFATANGERKGPVADLRITVHREDDPERLHGEGMTGQDGCVEIPLEAGTYILGLPTLHHEWRWSCTGNVLAKEHEDHCTKVMIHDGRCTKVECGISEKQTCLGLNLLTRGDACTRTPCSHIPSGRSFWIEVTTPSGLAAPHFSVSDGDLDPAQKYAEAGTVRYEALVSGTSQMRGAFSYGAVVPLTHDPHGPKVQMKEQGEVVADDRVISGHIATTTTLSRTTTPFTRDTALFVAINNATEALSFDNYQRFMDTLFCHTDKRPAGQPRLFAKEEAKYEGLGGLLSRRYLPFTDTDSYRVVKAATEAFVMVNCGVRDDEFRGLDRERDLAYLERRDLTAPKEGLAASLRKYLVDVDGGQRILPYLAVIRSKLSDLPVLRQQHHDNEALDDCYGLLLEKLTHPCFLELIWSYWQEEGMLVQSMNAISRRFQNVRAPNGQDPLANLEMNPLRPLNNLMWGYIQDEQHRLSLVRRNYEYDHLYGLHLDGKAVRDFRPADTRSRFLEAFHQLLRLATVFYKQDDDTTVKADAFPVLNALKEVHLILSQGAGNQFGDLPSTARIEMMMQQWFLSRPEFREFLPTRVMVAYPEPWMDLVDAMKKLQGWTDTSVLHFRDLAVFGEQLLLSIRWGHWSVVSEPLQAFNWARLYRPQVQGYIHAYRAATGVDLSADPTVDSRVDATLPSQLLRRRLATQQRSG
jgi:hypothetical protein